MYERRSTNWEDIEECEIDEDNERIKDKWAIEEANSEERIKEDNEVKKIFGWDSEEVQRRTRTAIRERQISFRT